MTAVTQNRVGGVQSNAEMVTTFKLFILYHMRVHVKSIQKLTDPCLNYERKQLKITELVAHENLTNHSFLIIL